MFSSTTPGKASRAQGVGLILNVCSLAGRIRLPFQGGICSAAGFALKGVSEALRLELRPFGVRVVLVEPGDIRTRSEGGGRSGKRRPTSAPDRIPRSSPTS
jgi:short-subunit dehydrogenase